MKTKQLDAAQGGFTKERYDEIKKRADISGIIILTKWRKGLKNIKVEPIILWEE